MSVSEGNFADLTGICILLTLVVGPLLMFYLLMHLTNIVVRTSITVRFTETWNQVQQKCSLFYLGLKEEWLEVHGGVSNNVHEDGWHVHGHEHTQETSPKDNLGWLWDMFNIRELKQCSAGCGSDHLDTYCGVVFSQLHRGLPRSILFSFVQYQPMWILSTTWWSTEWAHDHQSRFGYLESAQAGQWYYYSFKFTIIVFF